VSSQKALEDLPMIRRADLENHNRDGGLWIVVDRKVYDVQDFRYVSPLKKFNLYVLMSSLHCDMVISISTSYSGGSRFEPGILVRNKVFWYFLWLH
jgi:Cytochrome b5-like Heme/Steroid binding domain.